MNPLVLGLTGGIATGKSTFAAALRRLGAPVLDADALAREAVLPGSRALTEIARQFGGEVLLPGGALDRAAMARLVFRDGEARARLERIVHPEVRALFASRCAALAAAGQPRVVYDVPLLFEAGRASEVDRVAVVWALPEVQLARLRERDGLDEAAAAARLAAQWPLAEKLAKADAVIVNDSDLAALEAKAGRLWEDLGQGLPRRLPKGEPARY